MAEAPAPLEGDAVRIEQLTQKLAQAQHSQSLFGLPFLDRTLSPAGPNGGPHSTRPRTTYAGPTGSQDIQENLMNTRNLHMADPFSPYNMASASSSYNQGDSGSQLSLPRARTAPAIAPPLVRVQSARKETSFRLLTQARRSINDNAPENRVRTASSDVVPFLYQDTATEEIRTPAHEIRNPFDNAFDGSAMNGSAPFTPAYSHSAVGHAPDVRSPGRERRDAADLTAVGKIQAPSKSRAFLNNFMSKKKKKAATANAQAQAQPPIPATPQTVVGRDELRNSYDISPLQSNRSSYHSQSLASLRLPYRRKESVEPKTVRSKRSNVSFTHKNTEVSAGGIMLDTDMSHMSGIVGVNKERLTSLPDPSFSFNNLRNGSISVNNNLDEEAIWAPPESWAVRRLEDIARDDTELDETDPLDEAVVEVDRKESQISANTQNSDPSRKGPVHQMRIFRGDWTFATVACVLHTTTESLMTLLGRKFFLRSVANHQILIQRNGLSRILQSWEKPFVIQKVLLEEAGYTADDRIEEVGREDNSYLCRFIFRQCIAPAFAVDSEANGYTHEHFDLSGRNVQTLPVILYTHANTIKSLDLSRNLSLDIPMDFIQSCPQLQSIVCTHNELVRVPPNLMHAAALCILDVSFNRLTELDESLDRLTNLVSLVARNNRLTRLPASMASMTGLTRVTMSSNTLTQFPKEICSLIQLEDLDLSFNAIGAIPDRIGDLTQLQRLLINNNRIIGSLPRGFNKLAKLREIDVRFNHLTTLDILSECPLLESIGAGHNAITVVDAQFPSARLFYLNKCPVTKFSLMTSGMTLTSLDLSNAKLPSIPNETFDSMTNLIKLVLDYNHFTYLPPQLGKLTRLQHLSATSNQLSSLPEEIGSLVELRVLDVHSNNLKALPPQVWLLTGLISLNASSNLLTTFPEPPVQIQQQDPVVKVGGLTPVIEEHAFVESQRKGSTTSIHTRSTNTMAQTLKYLFLGDNRMEEVCFESITLLQELRVLNLSFNELYEIPAMGLRRLHHLVELYLSGNELTSLPADDLEEMQTLRVLHVNANKLQTLPAEIGKIRRLLVLDVGSNALKYNTANWPYDWNWNWNLDLKYLNLSGNKKLEIKPSHNTTARDRNLSDFGALTKLRVLGLMDITLTIDSVPDESENRRVRLSGSEIAHMSYGQADTLGRHDHLSIIDMVVPRFQGRDDEVIFGMFDGSEVQNGGSKVSKHLQDFFLDHLSVELKRLRRDEDCAAALRRAFLTFNKELGALVTPLPAKDELEPVLPIVMGLSQRPSMVSQSSATFTSPYVTSTLGAYDRTAGAAVCLLYLVGKRAHIANVGDALAVLSRADGEAKLLSVKHNAGDPSEVERIRQAGGYVSRDGLVNDALDLTRGIGYFHLTPLVQAAPHVHSVDLTEEDEFIIIASKSLWEVMSLQTAVDIARSESNDLMLAAQKLRDFAITYGAPNKISIMIIGVGDLFHRKSKLMKMRNTSATRSNAGNFLVAEEELLLGHKSRRRAADDAPADSTLARLAREVAPPVGDVCMIFTDIKNSTNLWENYPSAMRSAIKIHNGIMRRQLRSIGGYEVKTEGDAFMVCFNTTTSALLWCFTVQTQLLVADWPQEILESNDGRDVFDEDTGDLIHRGISVRMGGHWGNPVCEVDPITRRMDYFGPMVNRAARISAVADGGQITISSDFLKDIEVLEQMHRQHMDNVEAGKDDETGDELAMMAIKKDMQMLKRIGFGISPLGERKLKGLENAEFISLAYPKSLRGRLNHVEKDADFSKEQSFVGPRALDHRHIVDVYAVVFRLENLCSMIRGNKPKTENRVNVLRAAVAGAYSAATADSRLAAVLENLLTRVENALAALTLHYSNKASHALMSATDLDLSDIMVAIDAFRATKRNHVGNPSGTEREG